MPVSDEPWAAYEVGDLATLYRLETRLTEGGESRHVGLVGGQRHEYAAARLIGAQLFQSRDCGDGPVYHDRLGALGEYGLDREFDLAMMRLFGGFGAACFAAYAEVAPLAPGWEERVSLHQLAPLVVHAIKFGGGYGRATERALATLV